MEGQRGREAEGRERRKAVRACHMMAVGKRVKHRWIIETILARPCGAMTAGGGPKPAHAA